MKPFLTILLWTFATAVQAQVLVSGSQIDHYTESEISNMQLQANNDVDVHRIKYLTPEVDSTIDTASGALLLPDVDSCSQGFPFVSYQHGTVLKDTKVPSQQEGIRAGLHFAGNGYIVSMPDYLGLGVNEGLHPYMHAESEATASYDMIRACREYLEASLPHDRNGELFLGGYSQGGHSTMALHRFLEKNGHLDSFDVKISVPMSGAYDISGVQARLSPDSTYKSPAYFAYVMESHQKVYGTLYDSIEEYYEPPYDSLIPIYTSGDSTLAQFNDRLPNNIYHFVEDSVLDNFYADSVNFSHPLRLTLFQNDLYRWGPQRMTRIFYCGADEQVFPENALVAEDSMQAYGANDLRARELNAFFDHGSCTVPAFANAKTLFDSASTGCQPSSLAPAHRPNAGLRIRTLGPSRKEVRTPYEASRYQLWSLQGKLVEEGRSGNPRFLLRTSSLPSGAYLLRVEGRRDRGALLDRILVR